MSRKSLLLIWMLYVWAIIPLWAQSGSMTDQQVMEYVEMGMQQGKSQQQIATELARRGVTREQAERVRKLYGQNKKNGKASATQATNRKDEDLNSDKNYVSRDFSFDNEKETGTPATRVYKYVTTQELDLANRDSLSFSLDKNGNLVSKEMTIFKEELPEDLVFGRNIFNTSNLTFEPSNNLGSDTYLPF